MALLNNQLRLLAYLGLIKASLQETSIFFAKWQQGILNKYDQSLTQTELDCGLDEAMSRLPP